MLLILLAVINFHLGASSPIVEDLNCQQACHPLDENKINVHLIPHSHDDLGWLKTFDQYYNGTGNFYTVENAGVQYIISSMVPALKANPDRRYIQVETGFFWKWWQDQSNETKQDVVDLVDSGQLEMINGGWAMNDEAATYYQSIIDQFTWGFRKLEDTVGECGRPKIGWQIDPFGHSREHASILKQLGFDGLLIVRIDYRDKEKRRAEKNLDFIWNSNPNFDDAKLFTTMFPDFYMEDSGFCFDVMCWESVTPSNVANKVKGFVTVLDQYKEYYKTNNIIMPMGRDFSYQKAEMNFASLDTFIEGFKDHETYNVIYSTPSCYMKAVKEAVEKNSIQLEEKLDDFFPYALEAHSFWTGYFTSRPSSKRFERIGNNVLQSAKQLTTFSRINEKNFDGSLEELRGAMGVMQHHDGITGTEKQAVSDDYARMLHQAIIKAEEPLGTIIADLLKTDPRNDLTLELSSCLLSNVSICETSQKDKFLVVVHNPLSQIITQYIALPVEGESYRIRGPDGEEIYDVFDTIHTFDYVQEEAKPSSKELVFAARDLPALGLKVYFVEKVSEKSEYKTFEDVLAGARYGTQTNGFEIDEQTGRLSSITLNSLTQELTQEFMFYPGYTDGVEGDHRSSGAYIFRPASNEALVLAPNYKSVQCVRGNLVDECIQIINDEVTQLIKTYKGAKDSYIEFDWLVGDIQFIAGMGKEVITRFTVSNFFTNNTFYTDANGRQLMKRELNKRGDFEYDHTEEPVSSNYYPVTSKILIKDEVRKLQLAVLNDRAQGGSSLFDGTLELMIHRRLKHDDGYGVEESLDEVQYDKGLYARGQHYLTFGSSDSGVENGKSTSAFERELAHKILLAPRVFLEDASGKYSSLEEVTKVIKLKFEGLRRKLPDNLHILTLEPWTSGYLLRLEHRLEKNEDDGLSTEAIVDLADLFSLFDVKEMSEATLGGNQLLESKSEFVVSLKPMEIKTFIIFVGEVASAPDNNGASFIFNELVVFIIAFNFIFLL